MIYLEIDIKIIIEVIISILMYTEVHYKFKYLGSKYYNNEPEILSDIPIRIEPHKKIPVLILIKDSNLYPIKLINIKINIYQSNQLIDTIRKDYNQNIKSIWWYKTIFYNPKDISGLIELEVIFKYKINNEIKKCNMHNYLQCSNSKMKTFISKYKYPNNGNVLFGDLHYHSNLTEDMVEFGAPLKSTLYAAESMGLDFFCNTDHSYDLDDIEGSWTETDPKLTKWNDSRKLIKKLNSNKKFSSFIIPSEELSLHNSKGENIHALILNNQAFLPGAGDGAEKPFNFDSLYNTNSVYEKLENDALCIAAHPFNKVPITQKFFFKRGIWNEEDSINKDLAGFQIVNGINDRDYKISKKNWINLLLKGYKKYIYAGNDAHGNFNLFRQISMPMISIKEDKKQLFGYYRTAIIYDNKNKNIPNIIQLLKKGRCYITNGPLLIMNIKSVENKFPIGSVITINRSKLNLNILGQSSSEFGLIKKIIIKRGDLRKEKEIDEMIIDNIKNYHFSYNFDIDFTGKCYYRLELYLDNNNNFALTNPIWIN